uniref:phosphatidate phosphatase n=1 Tax=Triatoma infestans TaxID=30076 RepID=A0A023F323_TRIIF
MNYLGKVINNFKYIYNDINAATLTGAIDVVVVEQPDGTFTCSPFHVRFGKMGVLRSKEKIVDIEINGEPVDIHMKLGESGEAFFVEEVELGEGEEGFIPPHLACSPIPPDGDRFNSSEEWREYNEEPAVSNEKESPSVTVTCATTPKTFRAETVEEEDGDIARKLSSNEFRPIVGQHSETSLSSQESTTTEFTKEDSPSADERLSTANNKRRRRKKSTKKKSSLKRNSTGNLNVPQHLSTVLIAPLDDKGSDEGGIFQIEDLDNSQPVILEREEIKEDINTTQQSGAVERDIHFFSDTELTPGSSPRDFAPVQSDSEFETKRLGSVGGEAVHQVSAVDEQPQSWRWGELPTSNSEDSKQESQRWMLQNMLGFMKKTKHIRHKTESEGIYLSELNSDDPEMASLYFPSAYKQTNTSTQAEFTTESTLREEDAESGNGPSLPQSPHSVEGAICGPKSIDSDFDSNKWFPEDVALSLCGSTATPQQFQEHLISYNDFCLDPSLLTNPKLVVRIDGKLHNWRVAAPILASLFFFRKNLPQEVISRLCEGEVDIEDKGKQPKKPYSWFYWSRANQPQPEQQQQQQEEPSPLSEVKVDLIKEPLEHIEVVAKTLPTRPDSISAEVSSANGNPLDLSTESPRKEEEVLEATTPDYNSDKYRKTLRLTSQQIASLKLHPGANEVEFSVTTAYQGTTKCKCFLFCWRFDDKIVVSDIDGTITKSDVLGHILPIVGKDWAQSGVAKLFTKIKDNGYKLLYLSARAIGQSRLTRDYLRSIKQEDLGLPEGPMLLNPTSLLNAFHTEVIEKKPEEFKISCLKDIQALFPSHIKPFYAGYGNKINDVWAYQAVGIPIFRIFTINHRGELKHELTETFQSTYTNMSQLVDQMFPASKPFSSEDFSQFVYWREPIIDIMEELSSQKL